MTTTTAVAAEEVAATTALATVVVSPVAMEAAAASVAAAAVVGTRRFRRSRPRSNATGVRDGGDASARPVVAACPSTSATCCADPPAGCRQSPCSVRPTC